MTVKYQSRSSKLTLAITSQPTTTEYIAGDTLSLTGLVVTATRRDGSTENVTSQCTFSPANGSTLSSSGTQTITATYHGKSITTSVSVYVLNRIAVTTAPTKTTYDYGDTMSYSGIVVTAYANSDAITRDVTTSCSYNPASGTKLTSTGSFSAAITWRNKSTTQSYSVTAKIYGVEWAGGSSSAWTRTDDASGFSNPSPAVNNGRGSSPFDNIMPWSGMIRVEERTAYARNQVLVKIPKFYYKWTKTGSAIKLQIANAPVSGFSVSPAHANRGDGKGERDYVYVGAYHTTQIGNFWYSVSGTTPTVNITRATARSGIHATNSTQWQWDFAMYWTICMLYLVEYADWDAQRKIGLGNGDSSLSVTGKTDSMSYHTGTNTSRTSRGHVRYRYIEDLWGNVDDWVDGITIDKLRCYVQISPSNFSDIASGQNFGVVTSTQGVATSFNISHYALIPISATTDSNYASYSSDICWYESGTNYILAVGGAFVNTDYMCGLFSQFSFIDASFYNSNLGCRLMKLP